MPKNAVTIDATVEEIPMYLDTYDSVIILGEMDDEMDDDDTNEVIEITNIYDAEDYFGTDSTLTENIKDVLREGNEVVYGYAIDYESNTETLGTEGDQLLDLEYIPSFTGDRTFTVEVDGAELDVFATYDVLDGSEDIDSGEAYVNTFEKQLLLGEVLGTGEDAEVTYHYIDYDNLEQNFETYENVGIVGVSELGKYDTFTESEPTYDDIATNELEAYKYGEKTKLLDLCSKYRKIFVMPVYADSIEYATSHTSSIDDFKTKNSFAVAHKYDDEVVGSFAGAVAKVEQYDKLMWKRIKTIDTDEFMFNSGEISDYEDEQINTVFYKDGRMLFSNGMSLSDETGFKWIDVTRSKYYIIDNINNDLETLMKHATLPYNQKGLSKIRSSLDKTLRELTEEGVIQDNYLDEYGDRRNGFRIVMPSESELTNSDERIVEGIKIVAKLPGHIQTIKIDMDLLI